MRQEFRFNGVHCDAHRVAFVADRWPAAAQPTINKVAMSGRSGSLRFPGMARQEKTLKGKLYLLDEDERLITYREMLRRSADLAAWLCPDGRKPLILDATPDRYYLAEVENELNVSTDDWGNGCIEVTFTLQPFTYAMAEDTVSITLTANNATVVQLPLRGNQPAPMTLIATPTAPMTELTVRHCGDFLRFVSMQAPAGKTVAINCNLAQGEVITATVADAPGMRYLSPDSMLPFILSPGANELVVWSNAPCAITLAARGRWL